MSTILLFQMHFLLKDYKECHKNRSFDRAITHKSTISYILSCQQRHIGASNQTNGWNSSTIEPALLHACNYLSCTYIYRFDNARVWCLYKSVCFLKTFYKLKTVSSLMCSVALIRGDSPSFSPLCHRGKFDIIVCFSSYYIHSTDRLFI